ncbi:monooxygenase [Pseudovirgaria hyperparasitica]|uniref:Monooxygenase n=1 Tax=Pseudovirgaria hyperparasitica TaxID=470096 RepID=A0A6A6WGM4_9PEZI|nr:monooxygenase [Pseudovirgaria hyperparasitica]KAF2761943.1 monooxygenase [Pseudovirgaria hyperparasitica]
MLFAVLFNLLLLSLSTALALPLDESRGTCTKPQLRREWRDLSRADRKSYVAAVLCMKKKPSSIGLSTSLYDDFPWVHNKLTNEIHFVASFLPWHRYFISIYEQALKGCGYSGVATYWDWTRDVASMPSSPVFSPINGFGGNGSPDKAMQLDGNTQRCVADGPLKDLQLPYFGDNAEPHCLLRTFNAGGEDAGDMLSPNYTPDAVEQVMQSQDYDSFRIALESGPHGAIHAALGGDMSPATAPNDPLFFLHHAQVDRLWWLWQQESPLVRTREYAGIRTQDQLDGVIPPGAQVTDLLHMAGLASDIKVEELLTTQNRRLCYRY